VRCFAPSCLRIADTSFILTNQYRGAQHSTAQHSTAQHSTAQHRTSTGNRQQQIL
jgi:hypothetical protein